MKGSFLVALISVLFCSPLTAQNELFAGAFDEFTTRQLWAYEEIEVEWKMKGLLQANFNEALNSLIEGDMEYAVTGFTNVLSVDSTLWQAYYFRAAASKHLKRFKIAERDIRQALKLHGDFYQGLVELAKLHFLRGQIPESERAINQAIRFDRGKGAAYYIKGDIDLAQEQVRAAVSNYNDCLAVDSLFHDARIKLALIELIAKNDEDNALRQLNRVLSYDSMQESALLFRGILSYGKDIDKKEAIKDLTLVVRRNPDQLIAYYLRGLYAAESGDYTRAFSDFHRIIKATYTDDNNYSGSQSWLDKKIDLQNVGAYTVTRVYGLPEEDADKIKQAYCCIVTNEFDKSIAITSSVTNATKEPLALYLNAVAHEHKGKHNIAFAFYNKALEQDYDILDAHKKRGVYLQEMKNWDASIHDFSEMLRINEQAYFAYRARGVSYYGNGQYDQAISDFTEYLTHDSTNKEVLSYRGMAYREMNKTLEASMDFAYSSSFNMLDFKRLEKQIDSVLIVGDTLKTLSYLTKFIAKVDFYTEGYAQMFKIYLSKDQWHPVEKDVEKALRFSRPDVSPSTRSYLYTIQAMVYFKQGKSKEAVENLDRAILLNRSNSDAYFERGKFYLEVGKKAKAESDLTIAASLGHIRAKQLIYE